MRKTTKPRIFILDTSAILSGKPINMDNGVFLTTPSAAGELKPGGRDYLAFQFLIEKGLSIHIPSKESMSKIDDISTTTGDKDRLSNTDKEILALALDMSKDKKKETIIITDDYSIQNMAHVLKIKFENISQPGITKKFKWIYQCSGCGKKFKENIKTCPICGTSTKNVVSYKEDIIDKKT